MSDFYGHILEQISPEYEVFSKRYPRIMKKLQDADDRGNLKKLKEEFDAVIRILRSPSARSAAASTPLIF